tara:strand:- start:6411 stop:7121 length:711 start_codon:yes stop_codon:yes gene_type:complete
LREFFNTLIIESTTYCNRKCSYCPNSLYERGSEQKQITLDEEVFFKIIDELSELKFSGRILPHLYGEPLLDKRLPLLINYVKKKLKKSLVVIHSNGDYLNQEILKELDLAGTDAIIVTEHGKFPNSRVETLTRNNKSKLKLIYRSSEDLELMNRGGSVNVANPVRFKKCFYPSQALTVSAHGKVILCCNDYHGEVEIGNLRNETISEIWTKEKFKEIRSRTKKGDFQLEICKKCTA